MQIQRVVQDGVLDDSPNELDKQLNESYRKGCKSLNRQWDLLSTSKITGSELLFQKTIFGFRLIYVELAREFRNSVRDHGLDISSVIGYGGVILKMKESVEWIQNKGNRDMNKLAKERGFQKQVAEDIKRLWGPVSHITKRYKDYRDKIAAHYDDDILEYINSMKAISADELVTDYQSIILYTHGAGKILKKIGANAYEAEGRS